MVILWYIVPVLKTSQLAILKILFGKHQSDIFCLTISYYDHVSLSVCDTSSNNF